MSDLLNLGLVGAGGHGREMMPILQAYAARLSNKYSNIKVCYVDKNDGVSLNGVDVLSEDSFLTLTGEKYFNVAISNSKIRQSVA